MIIRRITFLTVGLVLATSAHLTIAIQTPAPAAAVPIIDRLVNRVNPPPPNADDDDAAAPIPSPTPQTPPATIEEINPLPENTPQAPAAQTAPPPTAPAQSQARQQAASRRQRDQAAAVTDSPTVLAAKPRQAQTPEPTPAFPATTDTNITYASSSLNPQLTRRGEIAAAVLAGLGLGFIALTYLPARARRQSRLPSGLTGTQNVQQSYE